ncbi:MAG: enoyl-CoA hydratase/isomerase family protein, partial [Elusimicrobia bacterium]|nr:enoyl-CoA hydratase/isomerase family protein [Elusimicrobiota bacterium]
MSPLRIEKQGVVATVTLNRPEARNAFDESAIAALTKCFQGLSKERELRAVVVRGAGQDFCAGADIRWMRRASGLAPVQSRKDAARLVAMCRTIDECPVPVIVRVHGACFGGGLGIVAACDIAVAADNAVMAFSECRLGILPAVVSSFVLPKIGPGQARRYFLTGERFGAQTARSIGLVHETAPESELDARVGAVLKNILACGPAAVREAKALIRRTAGL